MKKLIVTALTIFTTAVVSLSTKQVNAQNLTVSAVQVTQSDLRKDIASAD